MAFSAEELRRIYSLVGALWRRITVHELRDQLEFVMEVDAHAVTIQEVRPAFQDPSKKTRHGVARFRYFRSRDESRSPDLRPPK